MSTSYMCILMQQIFGSVNQSIDRPVSLSNHQSVVSHSIYQFIKSSISESPHHHLLYLSEERVSTRGWTRKMDLAMDLCRHAKRPRTPTEEKGSVKDKDGSGSDKGSKHASSCTSVNVLAAAVVTGTFAASRR